MSNYNLHAVIKIEQGTDFFGETLNEEVTYAIPVNNFITVSDELDETVKRIYVAFVNPLTGELITPLSQRDNIQFVGVADSTLYYKDIFMDINDNDDHSDLFNID